MERQARVIANWGENVYVKIPITNTRRVRGRSSASSRRRACKLNVTAMMTLEQVETVAAALEGGAGHVVSVFAGRIADTGRDPMPLMREAVDALAADPRHRAAVGQPARAAQHRAGRGERLRHHHRDPRHAGEAAGVGKDLDEFWLETVQMFHDDAKAAEYAL